MNKNIIVTCFSLVLFLTFQIGCFSDQIEEIAQIRQLEPSSVIELGYAWSTNTVNTVIFRHHGILTYGDSQYAAFYKDENTICFVKRNLIMNVVKISELKGSYNVYDAHNSISMGIDRHGYLHISYDQHGEELRYRRSSKPFSVYEWTENTDMTGMREETVTYPTFLQTELNDDGNRPLLFLYRLGHSSNSDAFLKEYNEKIGTWADLELPLLKGTGQDPWTSGPYWAHPAIDTHGRIHLFFTWRTHSLGENGLINNVNIHYAYSDDNGQSWYTSRNLKYRLPITSVNSETVFAVSPGSNLINQTSAAVDTLNQPHMVFYSNDPDGIPQYQHLWLDGKEWKHNYISFREKPFNLEGGGTLQIPISRPEILIDENDYVYVIYRGDLTGNRMAVQRLSPPDYESLGQLRILWDEPVDYAEPVIDRVRWSRDGFLTMLIQKNYQPPHDQEALVSFEPIYIVDWDIKEDWD